jgi:hypothetical protein
MGYLLAFAMESRGGDSWGGSDGKEFVKRANPITSNFFIPPSWKRGIFHTRAATVGAISERNAHPFVVKHDDRMVIGIHNGGVSNYQHLNGKYNRNCEVDSEQIFYQLCEGKPMDELFGRGTLAWFDSRDEGMPINLARWNYGDLEIAELKDHGMVFCSNREPIVKAARMCKIEVKAFYQTLVDGWKHSIQDSNITKIEELGFWKQNSYHHGGSTSSYGQQCRKCHVWRKSDEDLICRNCMLTLREEFEKDFPEVREVRV